MTDEIAAISVGLSVGLGSLDRDLAKVKKQVHEVEGDHVINFVVGKVDTKAVQAQLKELSRNSLPVPLSVTVARGGATAFRRDLLAQLNAAGPVPIQIKANLSVTEVNRIRSEISQRLGTVGVNIRGGAGGSGASGSAPSAPVTPHERRVADDLAAKVGRAVRGPAASRSAPVGPSVASQTIQLQQQVKQAEAIAREAKAKGLRDVEAEARRHAREAKAQLGALQSSQAASAATAPAGAATPPRYADLGVLPSGPASSVVYRTSKTGQLSTARPPRGGVFGIFRKAEEKFGGRRVSQDELRASKNRVDRPETPEEIEYASRPTQASLPHDEQTQFELEKRGRGVRGASRSGARQRNEPVLLPADIDARNIQQDENEERVRAERDAAVRRPARKSAAFYGSRTEGSPLNKTLNRIQFYKFDPVLGDAFQLLQGGDIAGARAKLRGFSATLAGADPRQRKKFFRLFRNVENVPPELLEKHAALQALFFDVARQVDPGIVNVNTGRGGSAPKKEPGGLAGQTKRSSEVDHAIAELNAGKITRETLWKRFPWLRPEGRAGGGLVRGIAGDLSPENRSIFGLALSKFSRKFPQSAGAIDRLFAYDEDPSPFRTPWAQPSGALTHMNEHGRIEIGFHRAILNGRRPLGDGKTFGSMADMLGLQGVLEHELGHVVDFRHAKGLSAMASTLSPFQSRYSRQNAGEKAAEMFAARLFEQPYSQFPGFYDLIEKLSKGEGGRAAGGPVKGGLLERIAAAQAKKNAYLVNEHREETFVGKSGRVSVIEGGPKVVQFPEDGEVVPFVPEWVRRMQKNAKDLTGRAAGGPVRGVGGSRFRSFVAGEKEAIASGLLGRSDSGSVQRVFVVNWPAAATSFASAPRGAQLAAGPLRFGTDKDAEKFAQQLGGSIGKQLQDVLGGTVVATPAKAERETPVGPVGSFERQQARQRARGATATLEQTISSARAATAEAQQLIPVRSLSVAVGQIFSTIFGGRGDAITRAKQANELAARATTATSNYRSEQQKLYQITSQLRKAENPKQQADLIKAVQDQAKATRLARTEAENLAGQAKKASEAVIDQGGALRNLAAGTVGVVAGTLGFSAALGLAQAGISAVTEVLNPAIERATGFTATSAKVTAALGEQIKAQSGATDAAFAQTAAQTSLSKATADSIGPLLQQRAAVEQGNKTLGDGLDLLHAFEDARRRGGNQGLFGTTSGVFGTAIGGVASTQELIRKELTSNEALPISVDPQVLQKAREAQAAGQAQITLPGSHLNANVADILNQSADHQAVLNDRIQFFNDALQKGGSRLKFMANATDDVVTAFASAADKAGLTELSAAARSPNHVVLVDENNHPVVTGNAAVDKQTLIAAVQAINTAQNTPDPAELIKQLTERIIPAQRSLFRAEGNFQRNQLLPAQSTLAELANPTPALGAGGFSQGIVGTVGGKVDQAAQRAADAYEKKVGSAIDFVNNKMADGLDQLVQIVPADLQSAFRDLLADISDTGQQIKNIQLGVQQQQVNYDLAQYNNELRIARRSLADARDLEAGLAGATKNTLGGIEGQNILLQRQLQLLGFELQQRQINFRLATAGFVSPGETPEEIAARIEEAKKEAEFAQKQLDIQKQLAANEFKGIHITADRNVTDILAQISLLEQGKQVTINTAAAQRALDVLNKKQQLLVQQAGTYIQEGVQVTQAAMQAAAQVEQQTGKDFAYILSETAKAWGIFGKQAQMVLDALTGSAPPAPTGGQYPGRGKYASGIVGDTLGPTDITVGEAAGEKVAILRNPKLVPSSTLAPMGYLGGPTASSGGINLTIVVTGNDIKDNASIDKLVREIVDKAEERLMRKTSLFGLRRF